MVAANKHRNCLNLDFLEGLPSHSRRFANEIDSFLYIIVWEKGIVSYFFYGYFIVKAVEWPENMSYAIYCR